MFNGSWCPPSCIEASDMEVTQYSRLTHAVADRFVVDGVHIFERIALRHGIIRSRTTSALAHHSRHTACHVTPISKSARDPRKVLTHVDEAHWLMGSTDPTVWIKGSADQVWLQHSWEGEA